jgi:hypothetical protein
MNITELDEFQGLTAEMVREWLREQGFDMRIGGLLHAGRYLVEWEPIESAWRSTEASLYAVAQYRNQSVQSLLREINPRMRKGWPSGEALAMHDRWIVRKPDGAVIVCRWRPPYMVNAAGGADFALREQCEQWSFWPCDEHGNKVRWPTDAQGNML